MDLLDRLLGHDAWTTRQLLLLCRNLTDEQLDRDFDIAHRTVRKTFEHIIRNVELWSDLMAREELCQDQMAKNPGRSISEFISWLDSSAANLARIALAVADRGAWDERWLDKLDNPPTEKTYGGAIAHVLTHSMHHRAHLLYMLRMLEVKPLPEGDVFTWEQHVGAHD